MVAEGLVVDHAADGRLNLLHLEKAIGQETQVANAKADQLDCVLSAQCIVRETELIQQGENKQAQK